MLQFKMLAVLSILELICLITMGAADIIISQRTLSSDSSRLSDYYGHANLVGKVSEKFCQYTDLVQCTKEGVILSFGCCMTQEDNQSLLLSGSPYFELRGTT